VLVTGLPGSGKSVVAEEIAVLTGAAVLGHDWAMSGLRPYPELQAVLDRMEPSGHRVAGWSILIALARAQLRGGRPVILDGVARLEEIERCREAAEMEKASLVIVATSCSDPVLHRSRIEERRRLIPNWYELDWEHVEPARNAWQPLESVDLDLDTAGAWEHSAARLAALFEGCSDR